MIRFTVQITCTQSRVRVHGLRFVICRVWEGVPLRPGSIRFAEFVELVGSYRAAEFTVKSAFGVNCIESRVRVHGLGLKVQGL